jgi:formylmethanofuran dehydrogenase subunit C
MTVLLEYLGNAQVPLEVEGIIPDKMTEKSLAEISRTRVFHGKQHVELGDFFRISGDPTTSRMVWEGDLSGVHWLGAEMKRGTIRVNGPVGRHVGSRMQGGQIEIHGNASDWLGGEMLGGSIDLHGTAGHLVGAAYRGSARGMTGGTILIRGNVGNEIGHSMRRGLIAVSGDAGDLIGFNMLAGTVLVFGNTGIRHGAGMRRGTIGLFAAEAPSLLPSFRHACHGRMQILRMLDRNLRTLAFPTPISLGETAVDLYHGDLLEGGRGELILRAK